MIYYNTIYYDILLSGMYAPEKKRVPRQSCGGPLQGLIEKEHMLFADHEQLFELTRASGTLFVFSGTPCGT